MACACGGIRVKMEVEQLRKRLLLSAPTVLSALLDEFSAVTDYRTLRDSLPRRLAHLLNCRCVLLYQRLGETLQFVAGSFDDVPGWSASLLSIAHINPIDLTSDLPEVYAWRSRHAIISPAESSTPSLVAMPLIYRQRAIGVLVAFRGNVREQSFAPKNLLEAAYWSNEDVPVLEAVAGVVALLLENTRLLERDWLRIHELSLLNSIASQLNCSMYEPERVHNIVLQRTREITSADLCELIRPNSSMVTSSWVSPTLQNLLLSHFSRPRELHLTPLIIERPGDAHALEYLNHIPANIKTFFAIPLLVSEAMLHRYGYGLGKLGAPLKGYAQEVFLQRTGADKGQPWSAQREVLDARGPKVLGIVVGAYHRAWKLRREDIVLLQVLASQASAVLENMHLVTEVVEARNQARKLLRQVLDDQRLKELILESVPSGLITVDLSGSITTFNRTAAAILGYHPYEVLGQPLQKILNVSTHVEAVHNDAGQVLDAASAHQVGVTYADSTVSQTLISVDRHGQEVVLDVDLVPLHNDQHVQIGWLATFTDVTSMHRLEEEKRRLDRLASLGEMAASVAREVRNPLASIKTSMQILKADLGGNEQDYADAQESVSVLL